MNLKLYDPDGVDATPRRLAAAFCCEMQLNPVTLSKLKSQPDSEEIVEQMSKLLLPFVNKCRKIAGRTKV